MLLREIADGLSVVEGGRVDSLAPLLLANLISGQRCVEAEALMFIHVRLTRDGIACLKDML